MKLKLRRRGVYVGTIVAMVAMIGGFALAALAGTFTHQIITGQNVGSVSSTSNTIYSAGFTVTLSAATAPTAGCQTGSVAGSSGVAEADNIYVEGAANSCPAASEWYEEFSFGTVSAASCTPSCVDTFTFATTIPGPTTYSTSFTLTLNAAATSETLVVFVDDGTTAAGALPMPISSISVVASGS